MFFYFIGILKKGPPIPGVRASFGFTQILDSLAGKTETTFATL